MLSFNGVEIAKGQKVAILKTPVIKQHEFLEGEVIGVSDKQVHICVTLVEELWGVEEQYEHTYKRYPQQVIVIA